MSAIGMVEVFGLINAITVADECLKTANVNLIGIENVSSGIVTVKITGDVGAVTSSVNSVVDMEKVISHSVIPNIDTQALNILNDKKRNVFKPKKVSNNSNASKSIQETSKNETQNETVVSENIIETKEEPVITKTEAPINQNIEILESENKLIEDGLEPKTVKELVEMVVKLKHLTYKEAKKLKKDELINKLRTKN